MEERKNNTEHTHEFIQFQSFVHAPIKPFSQFFLDLFILLTIKIERRQRRYVCICFLFFFFIVAAQLNALSLVSMMKSPFNRSLPLYFTNTTHNTFNINFPVFILFPLSPVSFSFFRVWFCFYSFIYFCSYFILKLQ